VKFDSPCKVISVIKLIKNTSELSKPARNLPSVASTFFQAASPPSTSSTSFSFGYFLSEI